MSDVKTEEEQFKNADRLVIDKELVFEIERDADHYPSSVGKLWTGATWLTVAQARRARDWLTEVLP